MASTIGANLHVDAGAYVRCTLEPGPGHVVAIGEGPLLVSFTAETSEVAERIGRAFLTLAERMRAAAHLPEPDRDPVEAVR